MLAIRVRNVLLRVLVSTATLIFSLTSTGCHSWPARTSRFLSNDAFGQTVSQLFDRRESRLSQQWNEWGSQYLQSGDIIFILGQSRLVMGLINFSEFSSEIAASRFSHVGIVSIEEGKPYVYDIVFGGPRRKKLGWYLTRDKIQRVAIRRPRTELARQVPSVIQFCRQVYNGGVPFDGQFRLGDDRYYCAEFVEMAWRCQGVPLSEPIRINKLPNFASFPKSTIMLVEAMTSISQDQAVFMPGNESYGIWSSPELTLLLPERSPQQVPRSPGRNRTEWSRGETTNRSRQS